MKILVCAALVAAQSVAAVQPAFAADIPHEATAATGTFGGVRLRVPFGGNEAERAPRLGLAVAPTVHNMNDRGEVRMRIGEGLEFGFSQNRPAPALSLAGRRLGDYRLGAAQDDDQSEHRDHTTRDVLLIVGGVVVLATIAGAIWFVDALNASSE